MIVMLAVVCSVGLCGCSSNLDTASVDSPSPSAAAEETVRNGVVYGLSLDSLVLEAGTEQSVTFTMSNSEDTIATAVEFLGITIFDEAGQAVFDTHGGRRPYYATVSVLLAPGRMRSTSFDFVVPEAGDYRIVGILQDEASVGELSFTSTPPR